MIRLKDGIEIVEFIDWLRDFKGLSLATINKYNTTIKSVISEINDLNNIDEYNWCIVKHTHKNRSNYYYSVIKSYIMFKYRNNIKKRQEFLESLIQPKNFKSIKVQRKYLADDKIIEILNNIEDERFKIITLIQILTAARAGDILRLRRCNINFEEYEKKQTIRLSIYGKGDKLNVVYIFDTVAIGMITDYLSKYDTDKEKNILFNEFHDDFVFLKYSKLNNNKENYDLFTIRNYNYFMYWHSINKAIDTSGVVDKKFFSTHDFRRCFARKTWEKYKDVDLLKRVLNHEDASTTLRYLKQSGLQNIDIFKEMQS